MALSTALKANDDEKLITLYLDSGDVELEFEDRPDLAMKYAIKAQLLYDDIGSKNEEIRDRIELNLASIFTHIGNHHLATKHLKELLRLEKQRNNSINMFRYYGNLAGHYIKKNSDSAYKYYNLSILSAEEKNDSVAIASAKNNLGIFALNNGKWELAIRYFQEAIDILDQKKSKLSIDSLMYVSISDNMSDYYFYKKDSLKGVELIVNNIDFLSQKEPDFEGYYKRNIRYALKLCNIYIKWNELNKATKTIKKVSPHLKANDIEWSVSSAIELKKIEIRIAGLRNDYKAIEKFNNELTDLLFEQVEVIKEKNSMLNATIQDYKANNVNREIERIRIKTEKEKSDLQVKATFLIIVLLLIILIVLILVINYRNKVKIEASESLLKEQKLKIKEMENERLEKEIDHKSKDISQIKMHGSLRLSLEKKIISELEHVAIKKDVESKNHLLRGLINELKQTSNAYNMLNIQEKGIEKANTAFQERLRELYPDLSKAEREFSVLVRLQLNSKEIATIRNINPESVRKLRQRLRKKLKLSNDQDIYEFISKI